MKTLILAVSLSAFLCLSARAELKWEQTQIELHPGSNDQEAVGHFKYQNVGSTPIHFKSVKSSCGCTAAQSQKDQVAPGEKGEITATFKIGGRVGTQVKSVTVETDETPNAVTTLMLKTIIPQPLEIVPMFVYWTANEDPKPKIVSITAAKDFPAKELKVLSSNADFVSTVEALKAGQWKISIQPKQTGKAMTAQLSIQSDFPKEAPKTFYVNASVTGTPPQVPNPAQSPLQKSAKLSP